MWITILIEENYWDRFSQGITTLKLGALSVLAVWYRVRPGCSTLSQICNIIFHLLYFQPYLENFTMEYIPQQRRPLNSGSLVKGTNGCFSTGSVIFSNGCPSLTSLVVRSKVMCLCWCIIKHRRAFISVHSNRLVNCDFSNVLHCDDPAGRR